MVVVVTNESNMASYFPEAGNLNGRNTDMCSDVAEPPSGGTGDLFELSGRSNTTYFYYSPPLATLAAILDLSVTTTTILHFGRGYVIMHKVYVVLFTGILLNSMKNLALIRS